MIKKVGDPAYWKRNFKGEKVAINYNYRDVQYDKHGWADVNKFLPADFDLVFLNIEGKKTISGWFTGNNWDGLLLKEEDKVISWKLKEEEKY